jgi:glucoamylase
MPNGGVRPGTAWNHDRSAWTPEESLFALAAAGFGDRRAADARLNWLGRHRTSVGTIAEKVGPDGEPLSVAPLAWTDALVVLTVAKLATGVDLAPPP